MQHGLPVLTFTYNIPDVDLKKIAIGSGNYDGSDKQLFKGNIDQVRIWNTIRTDAEILASYNKCLTGNETGLLMLWQFEEGTGTIATDLSGNNNHGTLTNMDSGDWVSGYDCSNLIAYYPFNGNSHDESGNSHDGTVNGPTLTADRFGNANSAYHYHGNSNNDYIDIGDWENGGPMSINMWVKWEVFNNWGLIFDLSNGRTSDNIYIGNRSTTNVFMFHILDGATKYLFYCDDPAYTNRLLELDLWTMITCTVDETGLMKAYKNSELIGTFNGFTPTRMVRTEQYFGSYTSPENGYFQGDLDDIRIYEAVLSEAEILNLYTYNTLKVEKIEEVASSNFYVNNNVLYFKNIQDLTEINKIEVYNLFGQKVFKTSEITEQIQLNMLQKGIYILKIKNENSDYSTLKFIIN